MLLSLITEPWAGLVFLKKHLLQIQNKAFFFFLKVHSQEWY